MHVRVRMFGKPDTIVVVESKLTKMEQFRKMVKTKFNVEPKLQRLFYGGKLLENGYTFHDYNIKLNDVIQLMVANLPQEDTQKEKIVEKKDCTEEKRGKEIEFKDAESTLYAIGDLVDVRDINTGAWLEGTLVKIVHDPIQSDTVNQNRDFNEMGKSDSDKENNSQDDSTVEDEVVLKSIDTILLYKINLDADEGEASVYCKLKDFRPRARKEIEIDDLKAGQKVMINHNTEEPLEKGYWYDFKVDKVKKLRTNYELIGTIYLGQECVPQNDTRVRVIDKIFAIEEVVPLAERTDEYKTMMTTQPTKRAMPLNCLTCRDDKDAPCKDCGCYLCCGKENPEKIVLCDECNNGYHMVCLTPPLEELPEDDWYCPMCKRDPTDVVAPGAAKQTKKANVSRTSRDWGRGMACVGKTKTCAMPSNHFGPIPGIEVGMRWKFRIQLSETGVHRPPISGIHGRDVEGAYSIVLSGGYEDDVDNGNEFTYTGSGGRDLSGNKRTAAQSCDQTLTRENRALARNCAVSKILDEGGDSGDKWREGKPVRVVRSYKMLKHFPEYAPNEGIRYDGIYKVVKYYPETGLSGFRVWKYLLRRDDPSPAPWEPGAIEYPIIYPDGYLEAEAERQALKKQKSDTKKKQKNNLSPVQVKKHKSQLKENPSKDQIRKKLERSTKTKALQENNQSFESEEVSSPEKIDEKKLKPVKRRREASEKNSPKTSASEEEFVPSVKKTKVNKEKKSVASNLKIPSIFQKLMASAKPKQAPRETELFAEDKNILSEDSRNAKLWKECMEIGESKGRTEFLDHVTNVFICIICQQIVARPVTTPCLHNFCYSCLNQACKSPKGQTCPCCRNDLSTYEMEVNEELMRALRHLLPGYDSGRK